MKNAASFLMKAAGRIMLLFCAASVFLLTACEDSYGPGGEGFRVISPYENLKPFPYKASLHNHSAYHPEWTHAPRPTGLRLKDYRDYDTVPPYGIVSITEHTRVTTPWNTVPLGNKDKSAPWGVENILWIPGNESVIGIRREGDIFGELLIIGASTDRLDEIDWVKRRDRDARSGWIYSTSSVPAAVEFSFYGTGFKWITQTGPGGGIAGVYLNGEKIGEADLHGREPSHQQTVFEAENLENKKHSLRLAYDRKGSAESRFMGSISMDAVLVYKADGSVAEYGAGSGEFSYEPYKYKHASHPRGAGRGGVKASLDMLSREPCLLVLAHPNSRLETSGEHRGEQIWTSSGYTYGELDIIFGDPGNGLPPLPRLPHALEVGNQAYDFSSRTGYKNAEAKWDYLLKQGHRITGTASDDSHGDTPFGGWIVVYTDAADRSELTLEDVMESLLAGEFYASQGPNIEGIEVDENRFTVRTDKPSLIEFISGGEVVSARENAVKATYVIKGDEGYVRGRVTREDEKWRHVSGGIGHQRSAWTNPLYIIPGSAEESGKEPGSAETYKEAVLYEENWLKRRAAAEKLDDGSLLLKIAVDDENRYVRAAAAGRLAAEPLLEKIAVSDSDWVVRLEAVNKITNQELLSEIALEDENWAVGRAAARGIIEQDLLVEVSSRAPHPGVRYAAVRRLFYQPALAGLAKEDKNPDIRRAAARNLKDAAMLQELAVGDKDWTVRRAAILNLTDQYLLSELAESDENHRIRKAAVQRITDEDLLKSIAAGDEEWSVRQSAVRRITDEDFLAKIAVEDAHPAVHRSAVENISSRKLLDEIGFWIDPETTRRVADEDLLADIALKARRPEVRAAAAKNIYAADILSKILLNDANPDVRTAAANNMTDQVFLAKTAVKDEHPDVRRAALGNVSRAELLGELVRHDFYEGVGRVDFPVEIDGDPSKWEGRPYIFIASDTQELSARIHTGWDEDYFYLAVSVKDAAHFNNTSGGNIWNGDCLQFAFVPPGDIPPFNLGFALTSAGIDSYQWAGKETSLFERSEYIVVRNSKKGETFYEIKIPFEALLIQPAPGASFAFNAVVLDDDDGDGYDTWIAITPGIAGGWNPGQFRSLILMD